MGASDVGMIGTIPCGASADTPTHFPLKCKAQVIPDFRLLTFLHEE